LQLRFKQAWSVADLGFGVAFQEQLKYPMGSSLALAVGKKVDPALSYETDVDTPYFMSPLACSMNEMQIVPANGPVPPESNSLISFVEDGQPNRLSQYLHPWFLSPNDAENREMQENSTALYRKKPDSISGNKSSDRRDYFRKVANRSNGVFGPEYECRMQIYAPFLDPNNFKLDLGPLHVSVAPYFRGQPLRFMICGHHRGNLTLTDGYGKDATRKSEARQWWQDQFSADASYANEFKSIVCVEFALDTTGQLHPGSSGGVHLNRTPSPMPDEELENPPMDNLSEAGGDGRQASLPYPVNPNLLHP
jgi:hypothetical protein